MTQNCADLYSWKPAICRPTSWHSWLSWISVHLCSYRSRDRPFVTYDQLETPAGSDTPTQSNHKSIWISSESRLWFPTTRGLRLSFTQAKAANNQSIIPSTVEFSHRSRLEECETLHPRVTHEQQKRKFCRKPYKNDERTADRRLIQFSLLQIMYWR